jgi:hypothetical protein
MSKTAREIIENATIDLAGVKACLGPGNSVEADLNAAGFAIVPKEPTDEVLLYCMRPYTGPSKRILAELYRMMVTSAANNNAR